MIIAHSDDLIILISNYKLSAVKPHYDAGNINAFEYTWYSWGWFQILPNATREFILSL